MYVCVYAQTHTHCTCGNQIRAQGSGQNTKVWRPEESRWTKSRHTCICQCIVFFLKTKSKDVNARGRLESTWIFHVLFEKLISPYQMGGLDGVSTSYIEEINVCINKTISYQSPAHTYGSKGPGPIRLNLHVAVLAYDPALHVGFRLANVISPVTPAGYSADSMRPEAKAYRAHLAQYSLPPTT